MAADMAADELVVHGAREHNLKDITVRLPRNRLICITGLSGSGKSSLLRIMAGEDKEFALAVLRPYNDWRVDEWCGSHPGRVIPLGLVPLWDAAVAGEEVIVLAVADIRDADEARGQALGNGGLALQAATPRAQARAWRAVTCSVGVGW